MAQQDTSIEYLQISKELLAQAHKKQIMKRKVVDEGLLGNPSIVPKVGVKPGSGDIKNGFVHASFGPTNGNFWKLSDFQDFFIIAADGPDMFYVKNIQQKRALMDLEEAMTEFYDDHWTNNRKMKKEDILVGGFYVCYSEKFATWNRCRVLDFITDAGSDEETDKANDLMVVQLLDYGTWVIAKLTEVYPFRPEFLELPTQACSASLYDNNGPGATVKWTPKEKKEFIQQFGGKVVQGYVMGTAPEISGQTFLHLQLVLMNQDVDGNDGSLMLGDKLNLYSTGTDAASRTTEARD